MANGRKHAGIVYTGDPEFMALYTLINKEKTQVKKLLTIMFCLAFLAGTTTAYAQTGNAPQDIKGAKGGKKGGESVKGKKGAKDKVPSKAPATTKQKA